MAHRGDRASAVADLSLSVLVAANVLAVIAESVSSVANTYRSFFHAFEAVSVLIFSVEYAMRIWTAAERDPQHPFKSRLRYIRSPMAIVDFLAIAPFYLHALFLVDLRFMRVLRLLRVFKLTRYSQAMGMLLSVFRREAHAFGAATFILFSVLVIAASGIYLAESRIQPDAFGSIPAAMWWAVATLTTVGYGDVVPVTIAGKIFGACISIAGIGMVALPAGLLASGFSEELKKRRERYEDEVVQALEDGVITSEETADLESLRDALGISSDSAERILKKFVQIQESGQLTECPHCSKPLDFSFED